MQNCIFCKIINKEIPSEFVYEDEEFIVIKDINPFGPISLLIIPKEHIPNIEYLQGKDKQLANMMNLGLKMVKKFNLNDIGFSFHINGGGVQEIDHLHLKLGGGWADSESKGFPKW